MPTTRRGQASAPVAAAVRAGRVLAVLAALALLYYGARTAGIVVLVVGVVGGALVSTRLDSQARAQRDDAFVQWAQRRGLRLDPDLLEETHRFVLLQERLLTITQAAVRDTGPGTLALLEWKFFTGSSSGRPARCTGLLLRGAPTGSHVLLRPRGRVTLPRVPGTPPEHRTGFSDLDEAFIITLEDGAPPQWIDAGVAEALAAFARRDASVEIAGEETLVTCGQLGPGEWDGLIGDGERLAAAMANATGRAG